MSAGKTLYTLNIDNYAPEIRDLTYPLLRAYARRCGARFVEITERRYPAWPVNYEKFQVYEYARANPAEWHLYFDADTLIHPETLDFTEFIGKDTVAHNGADFAAVRWTHYDDYFRRDGRNIGSCTWCVLCSEWCLDLWQPLTDLTLPQALARIQPRVDELRSPVGIDAAHLLDDYVLSRNIARYGLKFTTLQDVEKRLGLVGAEFFWHAYTISIEEKVKEMRAVLTRWKLLPD